MFGDEPRRLTHAEAITSTPDRRIESVWRFMIRKTIAFVDTLYGSEQANCDIEDVLMEIYIELREKDDKWEPDRGRYITYAARLAQRHLSSLRDRLRTVQSPRNSLSRMQEYQREMDAGTITEDRMATYEFIKRSSLPYGNVNHDPRCFGGAEQESKSDPVIENREAERLVNDAVTWGLMALTPFESKVLGMSNGLWGQPNLTTGEIALRTGRSRDAVKKARDSAVLKVRERLLAMGHPAVASTN
jgi:DNA-directed RNA polymerase specialized sigma24 family protein